jgi:hypothetical protein
MADTATSRTTSGGDKMNVSLLMTPATGYALWAPAFAGAVSWNGRMCQGLAMLGSEWLDFVNRRLKEDLSFPQRLCASQTPEEMRQAYVAFWQKAVEDYQKEMTVMTRLASGFLNNSVAAARNGAEETAREIGRPSFPEAA